MRVLVNTSDLEFLLKNIKANEIIRILSEAQYRGEYLAKGQYLTGKVEVELSEKERGEMLEALSVLLLEKGIGEDGNLNAIGSGIEKLIDLFNVVS